MGCRASTPAPQRWQQGQGGIPPWLLAASKAGAQVPAAKLDCCYYLRTRNMSISPKLPVHQAGLLSSAAVSQGPTDIDRSAISQDLIVGPCQPFRSTSETAYVLHWTGVPGSDASHSYARKDAPTPQQCICRARICFGAHDSQWRRPGTRWHRSRQQQPHQGRRFRSAGRHRRWESHPAGGAAGGGLESCTLCTLSPGACCASHTFIRIIHHSHFFLFCCRLTLTDTSDSQAGKTTSSVCSRDLPNYQEADLPIADLPIADLPRLRRSTFTELGSAAIFMQMLFRSVLGDPG